jgi:radical SAM superfamily enzyme YgiQ (UPF0313 family)
VDRELLTALKSAGAWMINVGIETGDPKMLQIHKSQLDLDDVVKKVAMIKQSGLRVKGLFIMGLPGETEETIRTTTRFIHTLRLDDLNMSKFAPYPGAPIFKELPRFGTLIEDWEQMNGMNFLFLPEGIESFEKLENLYNEFLETYYRTPRVLLGVLSMVWKSPHSWYRLIRDLPVFIRGRLAFHRRSQS